MLDNRSANTAIYECTCQARACVNKILSVLAVVLGLLVGAILGVSFVTTIVEALIPLIIFAIGVFLAIILIYFFVRCKCRSND